MHTPTEHNREITLLLNDWKSGDEGASDLLFERIYPVLRKIVSPILSAKGRNLSLQTTDVLHEVFLKIVEQKKADWSDRTHFFAVTAQLVRRIIVDHARHQNRKKRGGDIMKVTLEQEGEARLTLNEDWLSLDQALTRLTDMHPQAAKVVELRFFGGLDNEEISAVLGVSTPTVVRHWRFARAWLRQTLQPQSEQES